MKNSRYCVALVGAMSALFVSGCSETDDSDGKELDDCFGVVCKDSEVCDAEKRVCVETSVAPQSCETHADCDAKDELCSPKDGLCYQKWGCLDEPSDWTDAEHRKADFNYKLSARSLARRDEATRLTNISAQACLASDPECGAPLVTADKAQVTESGEITLPFAEVGASGFTGTIRVTSEFATPLGEHTMLPGYLHFTPHNPLVSDVQQQARTLLLDSGTEKALAELAGTQETAAHISFFIYDCGGNPAANVTVQAAGGQGRFVALTNEVDPDVGAKTTSSFGAAWLLGTQPGFATFTIRDSEHDRILTEALNMNVFEDGMNYVHYYPRFSALKKALE